MGKDQTTDKTKLASYNVVMNLIEDLLNQGRTLYVDNFYTSLPLAYKLLELQTHLVGTMRANRKYIPKAIQDAKLRKGEIIAKESPKGVTIIKWRDQRDVRMLSTCHLGTETIVTTSRRQTENVKPKCIVDYDKGKASVDVSDQLASYNTALRRCNKWYRKVIIEILWGTSLVNAYFLYTKNNVNGRDLNITQFRQKVILSLLEGKKNTTGSKRKHVSHHLVTHAEKKRARCAKCYEMYGKKGKIVDGKKTMASQVITICDTCEGNPHLCRDCFNAKH
ncbi:unnamed protein product [Acanthoscelides obtectus]|uniref:PiggyBac transposable element-derived protein domain-containing protein n=1 Tax=Acanthoscelides obtectus TaxID=200917 RepID=A0A9P0LPD0_ACAOB|nr:unnamed protein product [Acanthoscelides obtectus]CAK1656578.1 PiggyBac transposable element-derived protein 4 [Acanthoscelides obtectus]